MSNQAAELGEKRDVLDVLELEVRRIPGVTSVSFSENEDGSLITVVAPNPNDSEEIRRSVAQIVRTFSDDAFVIEIDENVLKEKDSGATALPGSPIVVEASRPELSGVEITETDTIVVTLDWNEHNGVGEASARTLNHAAEATLLALDDLGAPVPFYVRSVTPLGTALRDAVVVVLRSSEATDERFGVATGDSAREATARATLDALNRYLAHEYSASLAKLQ